MAIDRRRMTEDELKALVMGELKSADTFINSEVSTQRAHAMEYYLGEPFGNEQEGRSSVVLTDVADTVEAILPTLMRIFTGGDSVVQFEPVGPEDEAQAKQRSDYVNHVFSKDNSGFMILYTWFKDALIQKNGMVKAWWEEKEESHVERYEGLTDVQFQELLGNDDVQVTGHSENVVEVVDPASGQPFVMRTHDIEFRLTAKLGKVRIANVPPDEFVISREAKSIEEARFVAHKVRRTQSDLIASGYPADVIRDLPTETDMVWGTERIARFANDQSSDAVFNSETAHSSMRPIWVTEAYIRADYDGDGLAELRQVVVAGSDASSKLLSNEEWPGPRAPFYSLTPIVLPHRFYGLSVADLVMDLQLIRSTILRQLLDNMYLINNNRYVVDPYNTELDDFLTSRPGGIIRRSTPGSPSDVVVPLITPGLPSSAFNMLEYLDGVRENRTGITRYNQGLDADSLNKTATGITRIMAAAQQRLELIARVFAETGVNELFRGIDQLVLTHQDQPRMIRLRGQWTEMDPRDWMGRMDVTIQVGIGTNDRTEMLGHLAMISQKQAELIAGGYRHMVSDQNIYNVLGKFVENSGLKTPELFFTPPGQAEQQEPQPDPKMVEVQATIEAKKMQMEAEIAMKRERNAAEIEIMRERTRAEIALKAEELKLKYAVNAMSAAAKVEQQSARPS